MSYRGGRMRGDDLKQIVSILSDEKTKLLMKAQEFRTHNLKTHETGADEVERNVFDQSMSLAIELQERDRLALIRIEKALEKIDTGTYGHCECCQCEIDFRRLMIQPFTRMCIDCMMDQESFNDKGPLL